MDINIIITIILYVLFFLSLLVGALWGLGRGLKRSSLRLATLVGFLIIAGIITPFISKALLPLDLSWLGIKIGGNAVNTISEFIDYGLAQIPQFEQISTIPSVLAFVEGLPIAVLNIVVFMLLIFIMKFLSWILFVILDKTVLKDTKLETQIKKQMKKQKQLDKKGKSQKQLNPNLKKPLPLVPPKKRRLWGGLVGMVQGFVLIFLILMPITSLLGSFGEISAIPEGVVAEENSSSNEFLNETIGDILRNSIGEETFEYFETYNNAFPTKILNLFGFNNVVFDSLTSINVNGQSIALRRDLVNAADIYNEIVMIRNQIDENETWAELSFDEIRNVVKLLFDTGLVKAFAEDAIPYVVEKLEENNTFYEMPFGTEVYNGILKIIECYEEDPDGFVNSLKNDCFILVNIIEIVFKSGIFDEIMSSNTNYEDYIEILEDNNYKIITDITDQLFNSFMLRVAVSSGLNVGLEMVSDKLSNDGIEINLGKTDYDKINWSSVKEPFTELITNGLDIFELLNSYDFIDNLETPKTLVNEISSSDLIILMSLLGREIDLVKNSPLFARQANTPFKGLVILLEEKLPDFVDASAMLELTSWADELESLSSSIVMFKESGLLDYVINDENLNSTDIFDILSGPSSGDLNADSYMVAIITPILNSSLSKKPLVYGLNQLNGLLEDAMELTLIDFDYQTFPDDQNNDIINVAENITNSFSLFSELSGEEGGENFDLSDLELTKLAGLLTALQQNAFRIGTAFEVGSSSIDLTNKTVTNGGIFANYYISFINYIVGYGSGINYKTVNWLDFFESAQSLSSVIDSLGGEGDGIGNFLDLGAPENEEDLSTILDALGLGQDKDGNGINDFVENIVDLQEIIARLEAGEIDEEDAYNQLNDILETLINSENEDGENTIDTLVNLIENIVGDDTLSEQINSTVLANEQTITNRLYLLLSDLNPLDYLTEKTRFEATISDLTCGATFVLQQSVNSGTKIYLDNIDSTTLEDEIDAALTANGITDASKIAEIKGYLLILFVLENGI